MESLICNFYLSVAARKIVLQIRPLDTLACCWDVKQPTKQIIESERMMSLVRIVSLREAGNGGGYVTASASLYETGDSGFEEPAVFLHNPATSLEIENPFVLAPGDFTFCIDRDFVLLGIGFNEHFVFLRSGVVLLCFALFCFVLFSRQSEPTFSGNSRIVGLEIIWTLFSSPMLA